MKKTVLILMLALAVLTAVFAAGCANASQENTAAEQNNIVSNEAIDEYLASVKEQSDSLKTSLSEDAELTQADMNTKAMELSELWDGAVNYMIDSLKTRLSEDEFAALQNDQVEWAAEKDKAVAASGAEFEGGSFYSIIVNLEAARITEERVLELYEMLK